MVQSSFTPALKIKVKYKQIWAHTDVIQICLSEWSCRVVLIAIKCRKLGGFLDAASTFFCGHGKCFFRALVLKSLGISVFCCFEKALESSFGKTYLAAMKKVCMKINWRMNEDELFLMAQLLLHVFLCSVPGRAAASRAEAGMAGQTGSTWLLWHYCSTYFKFKDHKQGNLLQKKNQWSHHSHLPWLWMLAYGLIRGCVCRCR